MRGRACIVACVATVGAIAACAHEPELPLVDASAHRAAVDAWHVAQRGELAARGAPLAYTGLNWLHAGANTIGADSSNEIVLPGTGVPAHVGTLVRESNRVRFEPTAGSKAMIDEHPTNATWLRTDADTGKSSRVQVGGAGFRLIERLDAIGLRRWDDDRPAYRDFRDARYFADDLQWRVTGMLTPYAKPRLVMVQTEAGIEQQLPIVGTVRTHIDGKRYDLVAFEGGSAQDLWIVFKDATNGHESYGFRYTKAVRDTATNVVVLDFNYAYHPDCAYTPYATCPLAPAENHIAARITAGEEAYESPVAASR